MEIIANGNIYELTSLVDNVSGRKVPGRKSVNHDFSLFTASDEDKRKKISPQLGFALFQYLSTGVHYTLMSFLLIYPYLKFL